MDIDKTAFPARLLDILTAIAEANFVSFDLELSGVPVKQPGDAGKPSLQDRYLETKEAAEKFQILQIGITCVKEEDDRGVYMCRPFNFNLSPIVEEKRLDVDRTFSFHSGAVEFLLGVGFQIELPFISGVPYLSRSEAELAEQKAITRNDRSAIADIMIKPEDIQSIAFLKRVRAEIADWIKLDHSLHPALLITPVKENGRPIESELSRFERRLVHQLVRADYPTLITIPSRGMIRITDFDHEREERIKADRLKDARDRINRQTGFRWIIEALAGHPPRNIDPKQFAFSPDTGESILVDMDDIRSRYSRAQHLLHNKKSVLVGHNLFLDLIYLYKAFIGPLPDSVDQFIDLIHDMFPMVIDTKYMATHNCGDINPRSSLEEIAEQLSLQPFPILETHKDHTKYRGTTAFHEAGYDSLLTAEIVARLSIKLEAAGTYIADTSDTESADELGGVKLNGAATNFTPGDQDPPARAVSTISSAIGGLRGLVSVPLRALTGERGDDTHERPVAAMRTNVMMVDGTADTSPTKTGAVVAIKTSAGGKGKKKKQRSKKRSAQTNAAKSGRFAHATVFDQLQVTAEDEEESEEEVLQFDELPSSAASGSALVAADTDGISEGRVMAPSAADWDTPYWRREDGRAMPRFTSDFWGVYGNKLRVFGTQEGVCLLDE
ncbi:ribonuclease H-like domain-containing protein [Delphinella strobiligena]|nr:ribonuclease H-like domain-containing protein [Delphinella strobiligena]